MRTREKLKSQEKNRLEGDAYRRKKDYSANTYPTLSASFRAELMVERQKAEVR